MRELDESDLLEIQETLVIAKGVLKSMDAEYYNIVANHWHALFYAAKNAGFNEEQAIRLVEASLRQTK